MRRQKRIVPISGYESLIHWFFVHSRQYTRSEKWMKPKIGSRVYLRGFHIIGPSTVSVIFLVYRMRIPTKKKNEKTKITDKDNCIGCIFRFIWLIRTNGRKPFLWHQTAIFIVASKQGARSPSHNSFAINSWHMRRMSKLVPHWTGRRRVQTCRRSHMQCIHIKQSEEKKASERHGKKPNNNSS